MFIQFAKLNAKGFFYCRIALKGAAADTATLWSKWIG